MMTVDILNLLWQRSLYGRTEKCSLYHQSLISARTAKQLQERKYEERCFVVDGVIYMEGLNSWIDATSAQLKEFLKKSLILNKEYSNRVADDFTMDILRYFQNGYHCFYTLSLNSWLHEFSIEDNKVLKIKQSVHLGLFRKFFHLSWETPMQRFVATCAFSTFEKKHYIAFFDVNPLCLCGTIEIDTRIYGDVKNVVAAYGIVYVIRYDKVVSYELSTLMSRWERHRIGDVTVHGNHVGEYPVSLPVSLPLTNHVPSLREVSYSNDTDAWMEVVISDWASRVFNQSQHMFLYNLLIFSSRVKKATEAEQFFNNNKPPSILLANTKSFDNPAPAHTSDGKLLEPKVLRVLTLVEIHSLDFCQNSGVLAFIYSKGENSEYTLALFKFPSLLESVNKSDGQKENKEVEVFLDEAFKTVSLGVPYNEENTLQVSFKELTAICLLSVCDEYGNLEYYQHIVYHFKEDIK